MGETDEEDSLPAKKRKDTESNGGDFPLKYGETGRNKKTSSLIKKKITEIKTI